MSQVKKEKKVAKPKKVRTAEEKSASALKAVAKRRENDPNWGQKKRDQEKSKKEKNDAKGN